MSKSTQNVVVKDSKGNILYEMKGGNMTIGDATVTIGGGGSITVAPNTTKAHEDIDVLGDIIDIP